jgi:SAM-dependent methyltransferase
MLRRMKKDQDAYGGELIAAYKGSAVFEIIERDDGFVGVSTWPARYFGSYRQWSRRERQALRLARGRILDVGCGAGRFALHLQREGHDVTAIDNSPGAIKVSKWRGVKKALLMPLAEVRSFTPNSFDTVIMMGNNFGLFGGFNRAKRLLQDFVRIVSADGQIIAETVDPYLTKEPLHLAYHRLNRGRGRMSGQLRIRVRHGRTVGKWFDYLLVSRNELRQIVAGSGWRIAQTISDNGPGYTVVLKKSRNLARDLRR